MKYIKRINEDDGGGGVAYGGDSAGMGNVVNAQPSTIAGSTIGSNFSDNGGTIGSGDVSVPYNTGSGKTVFQQFPMGKGHGAMTGKKSRTKKLDLKHLKDVFASKVGSGKVMNFDDYNNDKLTKVTVVKEI
jgi:hypothetical protein